MSSHILTTFQPIPLRVRFTSLSRATLRFIFFSQYSRLACGTRHFRGCPCQKHPSTNTTTFLRGNEKSGLPKIGYCLRQPTILDLRRTATNIFSVDLFPTDLTCAIIHERFFLLKVSMPSYTLKALKILMNFIRLLQPFQAIYGRFPC